MCSQILALPPILMLHLTCLRSGNSGLGMTSRYKVRGELHIWNLVFIIYSICSTCLLIWSTSFLIRGLTFLQVFRSANLLESISFGFWCRRHIFLLQRSNCAGIDLTSDRLYVHLSKANTCMYSTVCRFVWSLKLKGLVAEKANREFLSRNSQLRSS